MELAIPLIAMGGLYMASRQQKKIANIVQTTNMKRDLKATKIYLIRIYTM